MANVRLLRLSIVVLGALAAALSLAAPPASSRPLRTALTNAGQPFNSPEAGLAFQRTQEAGATYVRIYASWRDTVSAAPSAGFNPTDPGDPDYNWNYLDGEVRGAVAAGLTPYLSIASAPDWAEGAGEGSPGTVAPDPIALGRFAEAVARRYSGAYAGVPRIRIFQVWNEPNASFFMTPQIQNGNLVAVARYRDMVNRVAASVHGVNGANRVVAGGLFPFTVNRKGTQAVGALRFMRALLEKRVEFDIWSTHPYTSGNAFHEASNPDDVSLGDLPEMRRVLDEAIQGRKIRSSRSVEFWVTEFGWDSSPPDPKGVPAGTLARWTSEALYQAWRSKVTLFTWLALVDDPLAGAGAGEFQTGLYFRCSGGLSCARPKPALAAFRFPFVAFRSGDRASVWGRTPTGRTGTVIIEQKVAGSYKRIASVIADGNGIFQPRVRVSTGAAMRARFPSTGQLSAPFEPKRSRDRPGTTPFGAG